MPRLSRARRCSCKRAEQAKLRLPVCPTTVDAEIFEGEIFRVLNFQGILFLRVVTSLENLNAAKNFVSENFHVRKWREQFAVPERSLYPRISKDIWEDAVGETLVCALEPNNSRDRNAVAVVAAGIRASNGPCGSGSLSAV